MSANTQQIQVFNAFYTQPQKINKCPRVSSACIACKQRKIKCVGYPCEYCTKKNYVCELRVGKKRGPPKKTNIITPIEISNAQMLYVQQAINATFSQHSLVEFYFKYLGRAVPVEYKELIFNNDNADQFSCQLNIMFAHIMKFFGNKENEIICINNSHTAGNLFSCTTAESVASLLMMAIYLGASDLNFANYINIAIAITNLPSLEKMPPVARARVSCKALLAMSAKPSSTAQKYKCLIEAITTSNGIEFLQTNTESINLKLLKIRHLFAEKSNFDYQNAMNFSQSLANSYLKEDDKVLILHDLDALRATLHVIDNDSCVCSLFACYIIKFMVEWRSGYIEQAFIAAGNAMNYYKEHVHMLKIWYGNDFMQLLCIAYFYHQNGAFELSNESWEIIQGSFAQSTNFDMLKHSWHEMRLSTQPSYNINQLETDLFDLSHSISDTEIDPFYDPSCFLDPELSLLDPGTL